MIKVLLVVIYETFANLWLLRSETGPCYWLREGRANGNLLFDHGHNVELFELVG
jgi:hypothetical protein